MRTTLTLLFCATTLFGACSSAPEEPAVLMPAECGTTPNVHAFGDIWLAGQPSAADFALAEEQGVKTVITLRKDGELEWNEVQVVSELGMTYVGLPWNGPDELDDEVFARSRHLLSKAERPILLHCGSANRVGALWLPWRVLDGGLGVEEALAEARTIGMRTPAYEELALDYIERMQAED